MHDDNAVNRMALVDDDAVNDTTLVTITIADDDAVNSVAVDMMGRAPRRSERQENSHCCGRKSADRLHGKPPCYDADNSKSKLFVVDPPAASLAGSGQ